MIEGHLREDVVAYMCIHDMVEGVVEKRTERAIYRAEGAAEPRPLLIAEVRHVHIRMLKKSDQHQMIVHDDIRQQIVHEHAHKAIGVDGISQESEGSEEGDVRLHDEPVLIGLEEGGGGGEVVDVLAVVLGGAGGVEEEVAGHPAHGEHDDKAHGMS